MTVKNIKRVLILNTPVAFEPVYVVIKQADEHKTLRDIINGLPTDFRDSLLSMLRPKGDLMITDDEETYPLKTKMKRIRGKMALLDNEEVEVVKLHPIHPIRLQPQYTDIEKMLVWQWKFFTRLVACGIAFMIIFGTFMGILRGTSFSELYMVMTISIIVLMILLVPSAMLRSVVDVKLSQ